MDKHTPGPWKAIKVRDMDAWVIAGTEDGEASEPVVWEMGGIDYEPNARLIAAAPDLLLACELIKGWMEHDNIKCGPVVWYELCRALAMARGNDDA